jgi:hypothetical protein
VPCVGGQGCGRKVVRPNLAALNFRTLLLNWKGSQQQSRSLRRGRNPILPRVPLTDRYSGPGRSQSQSATRYCSIGSAGCAVGRSLRLRFREWSPSRRTLGRRASWQRTGSCQSSNRDGDRRLARTVVPKSASRTSTEDSPGVRRTLTVRSPRSPFLDRQQTIFEVRDGAPRKGPLTGGDLRQSFRFKISITSLRGPFRDPAEVRSIERKRGTMPHPALRQSGDDLR